MLGIVYCIREISNNKVIYVGSTVTTLARRKNHHKTYCYKYNEQRNIYKYIRAVCPNREDFDQYFIFEVLKTVIIDSRNELLKLEQDYILDNSALNQIKAFRTEQEIKEYNNKRNREYQNTDKWREYQREYKRDYRKRKNNSNA